MKQLKVAPYGWILALTLVVGCGPTEPAAEVDTQNTTATQSDDSTTVEPVVTGSGSK